MPSRSTTPCASGSWPAPYGRISYTSFNGVCAARRNRVNPASVDLPDGGLTGLGAEAVAAGLGAGVGHAEERGEAVVGATDRIEVVRDGVAGPRLDHHPGAVGGQRGADVAGRAERVAHVVQAVEGGDEVVAGSQNAWAPAVSTLTRSATPASATRLRASRTESSW